MPTRREPKPPRPPRIITARLVVIALVVGVVLAVVSVVVAAAPANPSWLPAPRRATVYHFSESDKTIAESIRTTGAVIRIWQTEPIGVVRDRSDYISAFPNVVADDPRPPAIAALLDAEGGGVMALETGWPLRAAHGRVHITIVSGAPGAPPPNMGGGPPGLWMFRALGQDWTIPYLPLWPGLLGNTLFYALLVLTPLALLRRRKLRRRARRGLCVACGYELGEGLAKCPECGLVAGRA